MDPELPIAVLLRERIAALGLTRGQLAARFGFKNVWKTLQRLDGLAAGDLDHVKDLITLLPTVLEVSPDQVGDAVQLSCEAVEAARVRVAAELEAAWREAFKPHAVSSRSTASRGRFSWRRCSESQSFTTSRPPDKLNLALWSTP